MTHDLNNVILYAGHETPASYSGSYHNVCEVRYMKYWNNAVCEDVDIANLYSCDADNCAHLEEASNCSAEPTISCNEGNCAHTFS